MYEFFLGYPTILFLFVIIFIYAFDPEDMDPVAGAL